MAERETDRRYREWKENPGDETLAKLYEVLERHALRLVYQRRGEESPFAPNEILTIEMASQVLKSLSSFQSEASFSTWAHSVMLNYLRDNSDVVNRRREREARITTEIVTEGGPRDNAVAFDAARFVERARAVLTGKNLAIFEGMLLGKTDGEIGKDLGLSADAVRMRRNYFRKTLQ